MGNAYKSVHGKLRRRRGPASWYKCPCGKRAAHWSYTHNCPDEDMSPAGRSGKLLPHCGCEDLAHYDPRCAACHQIRDDSVRAHQGL